MRCSLCYFCTCNEKTNTPRKTNMVQFLHSSFSSSISWSFRLPSRARSAAISSSFAATAAFHRRLNVSISNSSNGLAPLPFRSKAIMGAVQSCCVEDVLHQPHTSNAATFEGAHPFVVSLAVASFMKIGHKCDQDSHFNHHFSRINSLLLSRRVAPNRSL